MAVVEESSTTLHQPHLNAEVYRTNNFIDEETPYYDYLNICSDGAVMLGCSNLTGRKWNGMVKIANNIAGFLNNSIAEIASIQLESGTAAGTFLNNSSKVLLCDDSGSISIWTRSEGAWANWSMSECLFEHDNFITGLGCLEPGSTYVTVGADGNAKVWDINDMICSRNYLSAHPSMISDVIVKPKSTKQFLTCSVDRTAVLWDSTEDKSVLDVYNGDCGIRCGCWLDDNKLVLGDEAGCLMVVDIRKPNDGLNVHQFPAAVHRVVLHNNSKYVAVCCDNSIINVWDASCVEGRKVFEDRSHNNYVRGLLWDHSNTNLLHSCSWDSSVLSHRIS